MPTIINPHASRTTVPLLFTAILSYATFLTACKEDPPEIPECSVDTDGGTDGCDGVEGPDPIPECADPEFTMGGGGPKAQWECAGQAGGAIVYNQVIISGNGGPGTVQTDPAITEFPSSEHDVSACCTGTHDAEDIAGHPCRRDCGRAACNTILEQLRAALEGSDVSGGDCDAVVLAGAIASCQQRVRISVENWVRELEAKYDQCVTAAFNNSDPNDPYTDHDAPFADERKVVLADPNCDTNAAGCFYQAELRPFCEIDSATELMGSCNAAGNPVDEGEGSTGAGIEIEDFGNVTSLVSCSGPVFGTVTCTVEADLLYNIEYNHHLFSTEGVVWDLGEWGGWTGVKVTGLDSGEDGYALLDELGIGNNDVIVEVNSTALDSWSDVADVLYDTAEVTEWDITVRKYGCSASCSYSTLNYDISIATPLQKDPLPSDAAPDDQAQTPVAPESSGCGCTQSGGQAPRAPSLALLLLVLFRSRRRLWRGDRE